MKSWKTVVYTPQFGVKLRGKVPLLLASIICWNFTRIFDENLENYNDGAIYKVVKKFDMFSRFNVDHDSRVWQTWCYQRNVCFSKTIQAVY